jgi:hypothetical protein
LLRAEMSCSFMIRWDSVMIPALDRGFVENTCQPGNSPHLASTYALREALVGLECSCH